MKYKSVFIYTLLLFISTYSVIASAENFGGRLTEIFVVGFVQLGDNQPNWQTTVHIGRGQLLSSSYAALEFVAVNVWEGTSSNIIINGRKYVLPISEPVGVRDIPFRGKSVIPIPTGALRSGYNTIEIQSGVINNQQNPFDDFAVADLVIVLSR